MDIISVEVDKIDDIMIGIKTLAIIRNIMCMTFMRVLETKRDWRLHVWA